MKKYEKEACEEKSGPTGTDTHLITRTRYVPDTSFELLVKGRNLAQMKTIEFIHVLLTLYHI